MREGVAEVKGGARSRGGKLGKSEDVGTGGGIVVLAAKGGGDGGMGSETVVGGGEDPRWRTLVSFETGAAFVIDCLVFVLVWGFLQLREI